MSNNQQAPTEFELLAENWFNDLRSAFGQKKQFRSGIVSEVADRFQKHYDELQKKLGVLRNTDESDTVAKFQDEYNSLVDKARKAQQEIDGPKIEEADRELVELSQRMQKEIDNRVKAYGDMPWNDAQLACYGACVVFKRDWATLETGQEHLGRYQVILNDAKRIMEGPKPEESRQELERRYNELREVVSRAQGAAETASIKFGQVVTSANLILKQLKELTSEEVHGRELANVAILERETQKSRNFTGATDQCTEKVKALNLLLSTAQSFKNRYDERHSAVLQLDSQYKQLASESRRFALAEKFNTSVGAANRHDFERAWTLIEPLPDEYSREIEIVRAFKPGWEIQRRELAGEIERIKKAYPEVVTCVRLEYVKSELGIIDFTTDKTKDFERGVNSLVDLRKQLAIWEKSEFVPRSAAEGEAAKIQQEYDKQCNYVAGMLTLIQEESGVDPIQLRKQFEAIKAVKYQGLDNPEAVNQAFNTAAMALIDFTTDVLRPIIDDEQRLEGFKQNEADAVKIAKFEVLYGERRVRTQQALDAVESLGGDVSVFAAQVQQADDAASSKRDRLVKLESEALPAITKLMLEVETQQRLLDKSVGVARKEFIELQQEFASDYERLSKTLQLVRSKDLCYAYREKLKEQADKLDPVKDSTNQQVLVEGRERMIDLVLKLRTTDEKGELRQQLQQLHGALDKIEEKLNDKVVGELCRSRRDELQLELRRVTGLVDGDATIAKAQEELNVLEDQADEVHSQAYKMQADKRTLESKQKELKTLRDKLGEAMKKEDVQAKGKFFGELGKRLEKFIAQVTKQTPESYALALPAADPLIADFNQAILDPTGAVDAEKSEQQRLDQKEVDDERALRIWEKDLNTFLLGRWEVAKKAVADAGESGDQKKLAEIREHRKQALALARDKKDFKGANARLVLMKALAEKVIANPGGGNMSTKLRPLQKHWKEMLNVAKEAIGQLRSTIKKDTRAAKIEPNEKYDALADKLIQALADWDANVFDNSIDLLAEPGGAAPIRLKAREKALDAVRQYLRQLEDPVLRVMLENTFRVPIPAGALYQCLNDLNLSFQIST